MSLFFEALNRPGNAYHKRYKGIAWLLVAITILMVTVLDSVLRKASDTNFQIDGPQLLKTIVLGVASYLLICTVMWLVCKCFGSKTNLQSYIQTWGISFSPGNALLPRRVGQPSFVHLSLIPYFHLCWIDVNRGLAPAGPA